MHCFLDYRVTDEELHNLINLNIKPIIIPRTDKVYPAINGHVDIQMNIIDRMSKTIIVHKSIKESFLKELNKNNINFILSHKELGYNYPNNIILNALILEEYFIHNTKYSDLNLLKNVSNKKIINVKQGYTKCSILPITSTSFITNDKGIAASLSNIGFDILLLPPGDILLPSLDYGFIGGVGGMISDNVLALFGELSKYKYGNEILEFLKKYNIEVISLKKGKLIDRGSLLVI